MKKHIAIADCFNKAPTSAAMITKTEKKCVGHVNNAESRPRTSQCLL